MTRTARSTRSLQVGFLVLLGICAAQVAWWVYDQWSEGRASTQRLEERLVADAEAAQGMVDAGADPRLVAEAFDSVVYLPGQGLVIDSEMREKLDEETHRRIRRYVWEGTFFLVVLISGMTVLSRALHEESVLRRRQQNFVAAVGHEFKSPLAGIRLAAETIALRDPEVGHRRRLLQRILEESDRLEGMVANLLDTARIEEGTDVLMPQPLDLGEAVHSIFRAFEERAELEQVILEHDVKDGLTVMADQTAVTRVLRNLVDNALKAVRDATPRRIQVRARAAGEWAVVTVADTGSGFDPKEAGRLFDKFYRPGDELRRGGQGSGLGLYIVRHLVERSGGTVQAESDGPGQGATFTVTWPLVSAAATTRESA
ncbi:MAG: HAMP domain-containing sensor histidine kinase [Candidatus Eisenbacteria bacterium]